MRYVLTCFLLGGALALVAACSDKSNDVSGALPGGGTGGSVAGGNTSGGAAGGALAGGTLGANPTLGGGVAGGVTGGAMGGGSIQVTGTPFIQDDTSMSGLDKATLEGLRAGGASCSANLIYPYEGTLVPAGLISPPFMWQGASDASYMRVQYEATDVVKYELAKGPSNPGEIRIPQDKWNEIVRRTGTTPLLVTVNVKRGGSVSSCQVHVRVARGNMVGAIYYNTYNHPDSGGVGAVLRLTLGEAQPQVYLNDLGVPPFGPCVSCHSVSANGSALAASNHLYFPASFSAHSYATGAAAQPPQRADIKDAAFGAITPDGKEILRMGNPDCTEGANAFPRSKNNFPLALGPSEASLVDMASGNLISASGLDKDHYMWMPQFSPDGKMVVFNDAKPDGSGGTDRRELAIMDYDAATHTFSKRRTIVTRAKLNALKVVDPSQDYAPDQILLATLGNLIGGVPGNMCSSDPPADVAALPGGSCAGPCYPAWPFFTPDGKGVIFSVVSEPDFAVAFPGRDKPSQSELWYANVATGALMRLDNANKGLAPGDSLLNYYPTVLPVAVGGYYWVFWTSTRDFGHHDLNAPPDAVVTDAIFGSSTSSGAFRKRIWLAGVRVTPSGELGGPITSDPSFPGFYLEGQSETGNTRAFATLNPCKAAGNDCTSGLDCCTGYCNIKDGDSKGMCVEKVTCAKTNEKCKVDADCCPPAAGQPTNTCLGGYCGFIELL